MRDEALEVKDAAAQASDARGPRVTVSVDELELDLEKSRQYLSLFEVCVYVVLPQQEKCA